MRIKGYIFDLDDTLYCEHDYVRSGFQAVARHITNCFAHVSYDEIYGAILHEWQMNGRGRIFNNISIKFDIDMDIKELVSIYRSHKPVLELYNDANKLLERLEQGAWKTGLITDGAREVQWQKIKALGLERRLDCIIVSDDLGQDCWKPSKVPYQKVTEYLQLPYEECVYIGDNPHKDFCTARRLGMHTIRVIRQVGDHMRTVLTEEFEAERTVYSLDELVKELDGNVHMFNA